MNQKELRDLLERYAGGKCDPDEKELVEDLILRNPVLKNWDWESDEKRKATGWKIKERIDQKRFPARKRKSVYVRLTGIAASVLLILGVSWYVYIKQGPGPDGPIVIEETALHAGDGVLLSLAGGREIDLEEISEEVPGREYGFTIKKQGNNQVAFNSDQSGPAGLTIPADSRLWHTVSVPNQKQFKLRLPDSTVVWLNTASTIAFPHDFNRDDRVVQLKGEAYFEVAHNPDKPFKVMAHDTEVQVTGTSFNVSAYETDPAVQTTLVEGRVQVLHNREQHVLTPGYQAVSYRNDPFTEFRKAHIDHALAWKNGYFVFDDKDIVAIMKSVARWYDIEVTLERDVPVKEFGGTFPVTADLDELLQDLELLSGIRFSRNGKEVSIMP